MKNQKRINTNEENNLAIKREIGSSGNQKNNKNNRKNTALITEIIIEKIRKSYIKYYLKTGRKWVYYFFVV